MISPRYAREIPQRYRLEASKCKSCGNVSFPPRLICPECKSREFETIKLSEKAEILTYTIIRVASDAFSKITPFAIAVIAVDSGARLMTQIADSPIDKVKIGEKVKLVFRKIQDEGKSGLHCYGYKAVLM